CISVATSLSVQISKILIIINVSIFFSFSIHAQNISVNPSADMPANVVACGDPANFTFRVYGPLASGEQINVQLPPRAEYVSLVSTGVTVDNSNTNNPVFTLSTALASASDYTDITYTVQTGCTAMVNPEIFHELVSNSTINATVNYPAIAYSALEINGAIVPASATLAVNQTQNFTFTIGNDPVDANTYSNNVNGINKKDTNYYIDKTLHNSQVLIDKINSTTNKNYFHLLTHGRPGELLINEEWLNAQEIAIFIKQQLSINNYQANINIYGCEFAKGEKGKQAIIYLEKTLGIAIAASDDITGINGDWDLEVFTGIQAPQALAINNWKGNLQDTDGDGVVDSVDLDDDNDGILDNIECPVTLLDILIETSIITTTSNQTLTGTGGEVLNITLSSPTIAYEALFYYDGIYGYFLGDNNTDEQITFNFDKPITDIIIYATAHSNLPPGNPSVVPGSEEMLLDVNGVQHTFNPANFNVTLENPQISVDGLRILGSTITGDGSFNYTITNPSGITSITLYHNVITDTPYGSIYDVRVSGNILHSSSPDTDGDGMPDCLDLDSDNDGCSDADEAYGVLGTDSNGDGTYGGIVGSSGVDTNGKVIGASYATPATTTGGEYTFQQGITVSGTTPPTNETVCTGSNAEFTAIATTTILTTNPVTTASSNINYQWQVRTNGGTTFTNISGESGTVASGAEVSLSLTSITPAMDNNIYKAIFTNEANICGAEAEATLSVINEADLMLTKTVNNSTPSIGDNITFTVIVKNTGPCDATGITVHDELPAGLIYVSNTTTAGTYNSTSGIWNFASKTLNVNDTETLTVTFKIGPSCRIITSTAEIMTSSRHDPDSTPGSGD
ncbi:MAG: DUF11 domain-containing protein, partial [Labilibaculum sp.]|nr:DUF11 domain-containing protein [Labilibaculum sp.]